MDSAKINYYDIGIKVLKGNDNELMLRIVRFMGRAAMRGKIRAKVCGMDLNTFEPKSLSGGRKLPYRAKRRTLLR